MQIATAPHRRRIVQRRALWPILIKQVAGAAKKGEDVRPHRLIFQFQEVFVAPLIVAPDSLYEVTRFHRSIQVLFAVFRIRHSPFSLTDFGCSNSSARIFVPSVTSMARGE